MKDLDYNDLKKVMTQKFLLVSKPLIKQLGLEAAAWIADMLSKFDYFEKREMIDKNGWFYNTQQNIKDDTSITVSAQTRIIRELQDSGILEFEKRGIPSRNYYRFDFKTLINLITSIPDSEIPVSQKSETSISELRVNNKNKDNENKLNNTCSKEQVKHFDSQSDVSVSNSSLIRKGMAKAKAKETPVDKPMNGPYKKIFDYWQLSGLPSPKTNTKIYEKNVIALRRLFKSFSISQIIKAIDLLKLALSPDYSPASLKSKEYYSKLYFSEFVHNERTGQSLFNELWGNPPVPMKTTIKPLPDPDPEITNYLLNSYQQKAMGHANIDFLKDEKNQNTFKLANLHLQKFWKVNLPNFAYGQIGVNTLAKHLITAFENIVEDKYGGDTTKWELWWFRKEDYVFDVLSKYLYNQALMR